MQKLDELGLALDCFGVVLCCVVSWTLLIGDSNVEQSEAQSHASHQESRSFRIHNPSRRQSLNHVEWPPLAHQLDKS